MTNSLSKPFQNKQVKFNGGSPIDWAMSESELSKEFKKRGCYDIVIDKPANMVLVPTLGTNEVGIIETVFESEMPTYEIEVIDKLTAYDTLCNNIRAELITRINNTNLAQARKQEKIDEVELKHIDKKFDTETKIKSDYEKQYQSKLEIWKSDKEKFELKQQHAIEVFLTYIGSSATVIIKNQLDNNEFRRAWYMLKQHYSAHSGNHELSIAIHSKLNSILWDGGDINDHIGMIENLCSLCVEGDHTIKEYHKTQYLMKSIRDSKIRHFDDVIKHSNYSRLDYAAFIAALQLANGTYTIINESKQETVHSVVTPTAIKCSHCDREGHNSDTCWRKNPCTHCGKFGHNPNFCFINLRLPLIITVMIILILEIMLLIRDLSQFLSHLSRSTGKLTRSRMIRFVLGQLRNS